MVQEFLLNSIQFIGQIYVYIVRIEQTLGLIPQGLLFLLTVFCDLSYRRRMVDAFTVLEDRKQYLAYGIRTADQPGLFPLFDRIKDNQILTGVTGLVGEAD